MDGKKIDVKGIMSRIPHRYPFLLVDRVLDYEPGKWIKALKNVTINEPFFQGHFPGEPIMPGVLQIEAMAQTGGILSLIGEGLNDKLAFFMTVNNVKFRKPVVPGDQLIFDVNVVKIVRGSIVQCHGEATVEGARVSEADLMFTLVDREKK
ncbi:MAG TPA: 3-hydroxyacyl-ACP dehydratase FabZ, partial [Candidatus Omnitrophota bacterium]|nr:3-hydroxyacyl-ACP dehydratase FabZ [Candidatus Omnitrophota bacterium]